MYKEFFNLTSQTHHYVEQPVISLICLANLPPPVSKDQLGARILAQERLDKAEVCQDIPCRMII